MCGGVALWEPSPQRRRTPSIALRGSAGSPPKLVIPTRSFDNEPTEAGGSFVQLGSPEPGTPRGQPCATGPGRGALRTSHRSPFAVLMHFFHFGLTFFPGAWRLRA